MFRSSLGALLIFSATGLFLAACDGGETSGTGGQGATGAGGSSTATTGGTGGTTQSCNAANCNKPGEICLAGECVVDCRRVGSTPCAEGTACDVSDAAEGQCVPIGTACLTTSEPEQCGNRVCGPGSMCDGADQCFPRVPCAGVNCDDKGCWGSACACTRSIGCSPAPVGTPGEVGTLHDNSFRNGLVDLEFDPTCTAWGVTLISGPDYLRSMSADGTASTYPGVTNLNMGEVSVLQNIVVPKSGTGVGPKPPPPEDLEVALSYICCAACGCQLQSTPQGVSHFDPATNTLPLVIPSQTFTTGMGPFGSGAIDTGPAGLTYGTDRVLYVGNVNENGDYHRLDLATNQSTVVTTFPARVYASTPFDALHMLVALEGGDIMLLRLADADSAIWTTSDSPVTGMVRDFFDGSVYVARNDGAIWKYDEKGAGALVYTAKSRSRLAIAPDGYLYAINIPASVADANPTFERWQLPLTR
ncbi:MAG: hypothetical protein IPK82_19340 [Polyangiaceae bacterium]|nr:hypothetical protein [Polyangiaceae bacterium]